MTRAQRTFVGSLGPLAFGTFVYLFLRSHETWLFARLGVGDAARGVRAITLPFARFVPALVLDAGPDLAWAIAFGAILGSFQDAKRAARMWFGAGLAVSVGYELAQGAHFVPGTFDAADLVAQAIGFVAGWLWVRR